MRQMKEKMEQNQTPGKETTAGQSERVETNMDCLIDLDIKGEEAPAPEPQQ
jgi:hypothetical protein